MKVSEQRQRIINDLSHGLDAIAEQNDKFQVEVDNVAGRIYVHCNGVTVVRIGHIKPETIELTVRSDIPTGG